VRGKGEYFGTRHTCHTISATEAILGFGDDGKPLPLRIEIRHPSAGRHPPLRFISVKTGFLVAVDVAEGIAESCHDAAGIGRYPVPEQFVRFTPIDIKSDLQEGASFAEAEGDDPMLWTDPTPCALPPDRT